MIIIIITLLITVEMVFIYLLILIINNEWHLKVNYIHTFMIYINIKSKRAVLIFLISSYNLYNKCMTFMSIAENQIKII